MEIGIAKISPFNIKFVSNLINLEMYLRLLVLIFKLKEKGYYSLIIICTVFLFTGKVYSQSYGLGFNGQEFSKDLRTGIDLSPRDYLSFDSEFEISFKISFRPNVNLYFGYIVRILDKKGNNIDLISNNKSANSGYITLICGHKQSRIFDNTDINLLRNKWYEFHLKLDLVNNIVKLSSPEIGFHVEDEGANLTGDVKIFFGSSDFSHFKTTDLPSMNIKDICIHEKGKLKYNWPLDEIAGNKVKDKIHNKIAEIKNPVWLKPEHTNWQKIFSSTLTGNCEIGFNSLDEKIYLIGEDQMTIYSVKNNTTENLKYKTKAKNLLAGRQSFYNPDTKTIFCYDIDQKTVSEFDFNSLEWKEIEPINKNNTVYLHHNQYYSSTDKSLYTFGGYGQYQYKNLIHRFDFRKSCWEIIIPTGDVFNPRYLASLGSLNDTVYILGGYGSITGKQILDAQNYYDLMAFSIKEQKLKKIYQFTPPEEDICFSNSMVIDPELRVFYALAFPILKYDGYLQLIKGSLQKPVVIPIAGKIPFLFHDIKSFSTLFLCKSSNKLVVPTMLTDNQNHTEINLFSIAYPPNENNYELNSEQNILLHWVFWIVFIMALFTIFLIYFIYFRKWGRAITQKSSTEPNGADSGMNLNEPDSEGEKTILNSVFFFGGFQVFNKMGTDITAKFTPLLKELFLLIWLFSVKSKMGISSEQLTELLWFDKDDKSASNNRKVNIAKLKLILNEIDSCSLSHKTAYWKIEFDDSIVFNDYIECLKITNRKKSLSKDWIDKLIVLSQKGAFLKNLNYEWLDEFKADTSNLFIDFLTEFASKQKIEEDPGFILRLADSVFNFDIVSEEAMMLKCKALICMGKHNLASNAYSKFAKDYKTIYNQRYDKIFEEVIL